MDPIVQRIQIALHVLKRNINADFLKATNFNITGPQMFMLHLIHKEEKCKLALLAEKMEVKPSAITVMIDRLEKAGYVERTHDEQDRRSVLVRVTDSGKEVLLKAGQERNRILKSYLEQLNENEVHTFARLLEKMVNTKK